MFRKNTFFILLSLYLLIGCGGGDNKSLSRNLDIVDITNRKPILITPYKHISIKTGVKEKLHLQENKKATWESDNKNIEIDSNGIILAKESNNNSQATITITPKDGSEPLYAYVSIVNWQVNLSNLTVVKRPTEISELITTSDDKKTLFVSAGSSLYKSTDYLETKELINSNFPSLNWDPFLLKTRYGHYLRMANKIYETDHAFSYFYETATDIYDDYATEHPGLKHAFAYDANNDYIFAGEYSLDKNNLHSVYRGKVTPTGLTNWEKIKEFDSAVNASVNSVLHIHTVTVDPYTSTVWVGTGDSDNESRLYYSNDHGESWNLFAIGSQYYRILSMWFTKDYIYWNTDSDLVNQAISRVKRTDLKQSMLTPRLESGETKVGVKYFVYRSDGTLPPADTVYQESEKRELSQENIVYAVDDKDFDYREVVANLNSGSHWYHLWVKDEKGEDLVIMATAPEGGKIDKRARVFGIKEKSDGKVDVQELYSFGKEEYAPYSTHMQLIPEFQDDKGFVYFKGRSTKSRIYKMKLEWKDQ